MWTWIFGGAVVWFILSALSKAGSEAKPKTRPRSSHAPSRKSQVYYEDDDSDDFFDVTIEVSPTRHDDSSGYYSGRSYSSYSNRSNRYNREDSDKCWVPKGQEVTVKGLTISNGMVYVGTKLGSERGYEKNDNCLINTRCKVGPSGANASDDYMPYWPSYSDIAPNNRRAYLEWLADGASDPDIYIGYVFLYFYGLERRLFLDQSADDADDIVAEITRLLGIYGDNNSVARYLGEALSYSTYLRNGGVVRPELEIPKHTYWEMPQHLCMYLGQKLKSEPQLNGDDLLVWFLHYRENRLRTPATRLEPQFIALMRAKLAAKYPDGAKIRKPKRKLNPQYSACSNTFAADLTKFVGDIPDVSGLNAPMKQVQAIADEAMNDLDKLSRFLGRNPDAAGSSKAAGLLPRELIKDFGGEEIRLVDQWITDQHHANDGVVNLLELTEKVTGTVSQKITKTVHKEVQSLLTNLGWNLTPAPIEVIGTIKSDFRVKIAPAEEGGLALSDPSPEFLLSILELTLGAHIAHADNTFSNIELQQLTERVEKLNHLSGQERNRLHQLVQWLAIQPTDFGALKRKLKTVAEDGKKALANIAISVAASDGHIDPQEVRALEAIYQSLGFDKQALFSNLHSMSGDVAPTAERPTPIPDGSAIETTGVTLDMTKVSATLHDTARASALLEGIFADDEEPAEPDVDVDVEEDTGGQFDGLDKRHAQLLAELLERPEWPREEYEKLATSLGLMPDGAMEAINEWSFETFDDAVIEDDEPILIYKEILTEGS